MSQVASTKLKIECWMKLELFENEKLCPFFSGVPNSNYFNASHSFSSDDYWDVENNSRMICSPPSTSHIWDGDDDEPGAQGKKKESASQRQEKKKKNANFSLQTGVFWWRRRNRPSAVRAAGCPSQRCSPICRRTSTLDSRSWWWTIRSLWDATRPAGYVTDGSLLLHGIVRVVTRYTGHRFFFCLVIECGVCVWVFETYSITLDALSIPLTEFCHFYYRDGWTSFVICFQVPG